MPPTSQGAIREVNAGVYAFDVSALRSALTELTLQQRPARALPDRRDLHRAAATADRRAQHVTTAPWSPASTTACSLRARGRANRRIVATHHARGHRRRSGHHLDRRRRHDRPRHRRPARTELLGPTQIGAALRRRPDTTLTDVTVGDGASVVRTHGIVGDRRRRHRWPLRLPTARHATGFPRQLGAFVETKNAVIGAGTKVPHLTYVGDADIGEHSNIGVSSVFEHTN